MQHINLINNFSFASRFVVFLFIFSLRGFRGHLRVKILMSIDRLRISTASTTINKIIASRSFVRSFIRSSWSHVNCHLFLLFNLKLPIASFYFNKSQFSNACASACVLAETFSLQFEKFMWTNILTVRSSLSRPSHSASSSMHLVGRWEMMKLKKRKRRRRRGSHLGKCNFFLLSDEVQWTGWKERWKPSPCCLMMFITVLLQEIFAFFSQNIKFIMMIRDRNPRAMLIFPQKNSIRQYFSASSFMMMMYLWVQYSTQYDLWERKVLRDSMVHQACDWFCCRWFLRMCLMLALM